jgi:hypothetical protein
MSQQYPQPPYTQQPIYQQPPQQYDPRAAQSMPTPPMQPMRKPRRWPWIVALIVVFFIGFATGRVGTGDATTTSTTQVTTTQSGTTTTPQTTSKPAAPQKWTTTHTFTGNGPQKTSTFTVPGDWKLLWRCTPSSFMGGSYNVQTSVTGSDGTPLDPAAINTICKNGNTSGSTEEHQGGTVYLDVNSEAAWTLTVQELK